MKFHLNLLAVCLIILFGCQSQNQPKEGHFLDETPVIEQKVPRQKNQPKSILRPKPFLKIDTIQKDGTHLIEWGIGDYKRTGNLPDLMNGRGYRLPPASIWENDRFICLMVNWTGPFSEHLFLPLKEGLEIQYFEEDIEFQDTNDMFVVHLISDDYNCTWTIESLITKEKESFTLPIYDGSRWYPWYESIERQGDTLVLQPQGKEKRVIKKSIKRFCL